MNAFLRELRRRNVFRVAGVYAVTAWLIMQVVVVVRAPLGLPDWVDSFFILLLLVGFPVAVLFAWAFEMTPEGVKKTSSVTPDESVAHLTGQKLDYAILAGLSIVGVLIVSDRILPSHPATAVSGKAEAAEATSATQTTETGVETASDNSIAVLPFVDLSPEGDQEYFVDGLSEELLNVLAQTRDLKVAGRTSSFAFKGDNRDLREIGELLNVSYVLEGSVRKAGDKIRVTAQLIKASDGYHVFSETYNRNLVDVFAVQDDIANKIGDVLKAELLGSASTAADTAPSNLAAFDLYLLARQRIYTREKDKLNEAAKMLDEAIALDPEYAPAYAQRSIVISLLSYSSASYGDIPVDEAGRLATELARKALALDPNLAEAHAALGVALQNTGGDFETKAAPLRRALELNPNYSDARNWLGIALLDAGRINEAIEAYETIFERDPLYGPAFSNLVSQYISFGRTEEATKLADRVERISGNNANVQLTRGMIALTEGNRAEAVKQLREALKTSNSNVLRYYYSLALLQLGELEDSLTVAGQVDNAEILSLLGRKDEALAAIAELPALEYADPTILYAVFSVFADLERYDDAAKYVTQHYGNTENLLKQMPTLTVTDWAIPLGQAYKETGRTKELATLIPVIERSLDEQRKLGVDTWLFWQADAALAVLKDDKEGAIRDLRKVVKEGGAWVEWSNIFDDLRGNEAFEEIREEMLLKINADREALGLKPLSGPPRN